ncbi:MAG: methyltransferase domain-containing protein [Rhodospirillaceae bacterium]|nr:methyltransferase domain-containing protein [Rhodospirillaceae bacterium]
MSPAAAGNPRVWDPSAYLAFAAFRARPVEDLLHRLTLDAPGSVYDLGCGAGNITAMLAAKWPGRAVTGLDSSPAMLAAAQKRFPDMRWESGDIAAWAPPAPAALLFSNAALHWVPDHAGLVPRLMGALVPGGILAAQMPNTADAPYRACLDQVLKRDPWRGRLADVATHPDPLRAGDYYDLLKPHAAEVDIWETHYAHPLENLDAVVAWVSGAALVPYLSVLTETEKQRFLGDYRDAAARAYRPQADGRVLFTMRRLFLTAKRCRGGTAR